MKKYLKEYREYINRLINNPDVLDLAEVLKYHEKQIEFFQHERLIHLIVTALISTLFFISVCVVVFTNSLAIILITILLLALLIPYILHYYFLENQVQALYNDFNELYKLKYGFSYSKNAKIFEQEEK